MLDFIFVLLVANGAADSMTGGSVSIANSVVIIVTVIGWNYALNSLLWYIPAIQRLTAPPPLPVIKDGKMILHNMRKEFLTKDEPMAQLREEGIEDVSKIKAAHIEGDGNVSVITYDD
ncbi:MAG TPA: YetF domain-containing protein [Thermomicrobiales bacterium]|nr:YetF domain-containing protein [Thermomicrobiales bacterium]